MDKLTREAQDHGKIYESLTFFTKSLSAFPGSFDTFKQFIDEYIKDHFQFEAGDLFPVVLAHGTAPEKELIDELQSEHRAILTACGQLNKIIDRHGFDVSGSAFKDAKTIQKDIIESMLVHTQKEDSRFFPLLDKYRSHL